MWSDGPDPPPGELPGPVTPGGVVRFVLAEQRAAIAVGAALGIAWMGAMAAIPGLLGIIVDRALTGSATTLAGWLAVLLAVGVVQAAASAGRHWIATRLGGGTTLMVQQVVTRRVLDPRGGDGGMPAGELVSRATTDARGLADVADLCCRGAGAIVSFVAVAVILLATSPLLGAIVLGGLPLLMLAMTPLWRPLERASRVESARIAEASATAADTVVGLRTVKGLDAEPAAQAGYAARNDRVRDASVKVARLDGWWEALEVAIPGVFLAVVAWVGGRLALDGEITVGQLFAAFGYAQFLRIPLSTFAELGAVWSRGWASAVRLTDLLTRPLALDPAAGTDGWPARAPASEPTTADGAGPALGCHRVTYGPLRGLDLVVADGERVGIACAEPAAVAALADLLARRADPEAGVIRLHGVDIAALAPAAARGALLVAEADPFLFAATLTANLTLDGPARSPGAERAAATAALGDVLDRMPQRWDTLLGERGLNLSGGQRQRVGLARALTAAAPVLVLLDPTSAVDAHTEAAIADALPGARAGRTTVLVTASAALLAVADRVLLVADGRVAATGTHRELLALPEYRALVGGSVNGPADGQTDGSIGVL